MTAIQKAHTEHKRRSHATAIGMSRELTDLMFRLRTKDQNTVTGKAISGGVVGGGSPGGPPDDQIRIGDDEIHEFQHEVKLALAPLVMKARGLL